jgi:tripartite ATP-independent transporter DctP family solute receptor
MEMRVKFVLTSLFIPVFLLLTPGAGAQDIKGRAIKLGYSVARDHPYGLGVTKFGEIVGQKSGGKIKVTGYADGSLGAEAATISSAQGGTMEMTLVSSAPLVGVVKEFALFDFPFLLNDEKEADALLDGPVGKQLLDKLSEKGLIGLCYWENGFRNVTNSKRPIAKAEDLQGLKIRTMQNPVYTDLFNTLGANAVPMAFTEVYTALETRAIDAQENPYPVIHASKFNEVQKYLSATKHSYAPAPVLVSKKFWDRLSDDEKKILQDSCVETRSYQRQVSRDLSAKMLEDLKAKGMTFNELPPDEVAKIREKAKPIIAKYTKEVGEDLVKQAYAEIDKVRKQK